jgi:hypothetical protein
MTHRPLSSIEADSLVEERIKEIRHSLQVKAKEYARDSDRLRNFNLAERASSKTREECIAMYRLKHEISASDIREDIARGLLPTEALVKEKYGDIINYFIIEEMSILQRIRDTKFEENTKYDDKEHF